MTDTRNPESDNSALVPGPIRIARENAPALPAKLVSVNEQWRPHLARLAGQQTGKSAGARWLPVVSFGVVALATLGGLIDTKISLLVVVLAVAITTFTTVPVKTLTIAVTFIALAVDNPRASPANGNWEAPWIFLGAALYKNLDPLPVCLLDLLAGACAIRGVLHLRTDSRLRVERSRIFMRIVAVAISTVMLGFILGVLRGGDLKQAVYQTRVFFWIPCFALGVTTVGDIVFLRRLKNTMLLAACLKALTGLYVALTVVAKNEKSPLEFVTTHGDSVTYSMVFSVILAAWVAGVDRRLRAWHGTVMVCTLIGLYTNQRRIAFVGMAFAVAIMYFDAIPERRRAINRSASRFMIPGLIYLAIAFSGVSHNPIFRPGASLRSVVIQDDRSSSTRDVENFNLYYTYKTNPLIGIGFGHEYIELSKGDYIGDVFPQYKYLPHNSLLGLFAYGGLLTATGFYLLFPAALFLGLRATKRYYTPERWALSMWGAGGIAAVLIQGFGDVGFHDQIIGLLGGIAVGVCGALYCEPDPTEQPPKQLDPDAPQRLVNR